MDGYQATRNIRSGATGQNNMSIIIIAMTVNAMVSDEQKCLDAGMNDYISKPISPDAFKLKLQQYLL